MAFSIPTLTQLRQQARAFLAARIPGLDTTVANNRATIVADNQAGLTYGVYGYLQNVAAQLFISSATGTYLDRACREIGIYRRAATAAAGTATLSGVAGLTIPAGVLLTASDGVTQFATQAAATLVSTGGASATASVAILAVTGAAAGNLGAGAPLALAAAIAGVSPAAVVGTGGTGGGADIETDASLRARGLARKQLPPQGGSRTDWWQWTRAAPAVTRAWVYPLNRGAGTVDVCFVIDGRADIAPLAADITTVQATLSATAPVTADWQVFAPVPQPVGVAITGLAPNTPAQQAAVQASLAALFAATTPGGAALGDGLTVWQTAGEVQLQAIEGAISGAGGVLAFDLTAPSADVICGHGTIATLGTVTFS